MNLAILSLISAIVAALLVFVDFFGTPPLAISIFSILAMVLGGLSFKKSKLAWAGLGLGLVSFLYLVYLFIALGA